MLPPLIDKERIELYCGPEAYKAGLQCVDLFVVYYREWMTIKGICEGTASPSYGVCVAFDEQGIANSSCTCGQAPCKHIAALLILWERNPAMADRKKWAQELGGMKKDELVTLVETLVHLYPDGSLGCDACIVQS